MTIPRDCKRLAEVDFPIAVVSRHATREKSIRHGQYSMRINEQYRVCFRWEDGYAGDVEVTDYHQAPAPSARARAAAAPDEAAADAPG